jgi:hypothetical protein
MALWQKPKAVKPTSKATALGWAAEGRLLYPLAVLQSLQLRCDHMQLCPYLAQLGGRL